MEFIFRESIFTKSISIKIESDYLNISSDTFNYKIYFDNILSVRLKYNPSQVNPNMYECIITHHPIKVSYENRYIKTVKKLVIKNMSFIAMGDFSDLSSDYSDFVLKLHEKLTPYKNIKFYSGISKKLYYFYILMNISVLSLLFLLIFSIGIPTQLIFVKLLLLAYLLYLGWKYYKKNKPKLYKSDNIPLELIPSSI